MKQFLILINFFLVVLCANHVLIDKIRMDFMKLEQELWKFVLWEVPNMDPADAEMYIVKRFNEFDENLKQIPEDILRGLHPIKGISNFLFYYSEFQQTEYLYDKFRKYREGQVKINNPNADKAAITEAIEVSDIKRDILNPRNGANATVWRVYEFNFGKDNLLFNVMNHVIDDYYCKDYFQTPQQIYYNLYNIVCLSGLKNYIMLQFAYLISRIYEKGNYTDLSIISKTHFEKRVNETMSLFRGAMELVPNVYFRCDPKFHVKGETYDEFTRLLQGHIQNEVDMNPTGTCRENCASYSAAKSYGCYDADSKYCREMDRCTGNIVKCHFIESHMNICLAKLSDRRYNYIEFKSGKIMGKKSTCGGKTVNSWFRWFVHCSYCMCLCDEQGPKSDRYINLRPVLADIKNNRVVTGLRLIKMNRILHLQIQEGKLLPYGYIDNSTVHWVPVNEYKITDPGVYSGVDYYTMAYESRSMAMDQVQIEQENFVVTGVRFQLIDHMIRLQVHVSSIDWTIGKVSQTKNNYIHKTNGGEVKINLDNAEVPTHSPLSDVDYNPTAYVEFTHTGFEQDAAQTTIPFIDIQPVFNKPEVPLMGAGLHFKGKPGYGGFIAPKIVTYDFGKLLLITFPKIDVRLANQTDNPPAN